MFKKKGKARGNQRRVGRNSDDEDVVEEEKEDTVTVVKTPSAGSQSSVKKTANLKTSSSGLTSKRNSVKSKKPAKSIALSFGGEEEEEEEQINFKVKKSDASRKLQREIQNERQQAEANKAAEKKAQSEYSKEKMDLMKKQQEQINKLKKNEAQVATATALIKSRTVVPDAHEIHLARKRREQARQAEDYVSLNSKKDATVTMRQEMNTTMEDGFQFGDLSKMDASRKQKEIHAAYIDSASNMTTNNKNQEDRMEIDSDDDSSEDEMVRWEREQIRKGGGMANEKPNEDVIDPLSERGQRITAESKKGKVLYTIPRIPPNTKPVTVDDILIKLEKNMEKIKSHHDESLENLESWKRNIEDIENRKEAFDKERVKAEKSFNFFNDTQHYVKTLISCLDEKVPIINEIEARYHTLLKEIQDERIEKQRKHFHDDLLDLHTEFPDQQYASKVPEVEDIVDSFGRRYNENDERHRGERTKLRSMEAMAFNKSNNGGDLDIYFNYQGKVIDEEEKEKLKEMKQHVFIDASPKFGTISGLTKEFTNWKRTDIQAYKNAYVSLCLPKLLAPFLRLSILFWNPLLKDVEAIEEMDWFEDLATYGEPLTGAEDPDLNLVPSVVDRVLLPKLTGLITHVWNVPDINESIQLKSVIQHLESEFGLITKGDKNAKVLINCIFDKLKIFVTEFAFLPILPSNLTTKLKVSQSIALFFSRCIKLIRVCCSWDGVISRFELQDLAIEIIANKYILPYIALCDMDHGVKLTEQLVDSLPKTWMEDICCAPIISWTRQLLKLHVTSKARSPVAIATCLSLLDKLKDHEEMQKMISEYGLEMPEK